MKKKLSALIVCTALAAPQAFACGMTSTAVPFEVGEDAQAAVADDAGELPAPPTVVTEIVRGIGANHASCDDTGLLSLVIEWPRGKYKLREIGFEFAPVSGQPPYAIFPEGPVQGRMQGRRSEFLFMWREGPPSQQKPIDIQVQVRAVTRDNMRGPATNLRLRSPAGG